LVELFVVFLLFGLIAQIFFGTKHIGGFDDLNLLQENGQLLDELIHAFSTNTPDFSPFKHLDIIVEQNQINNLSLKISPELKNFYQLSKLIRDPDSGIEIKSRRYRLLKYDKCFVGSHLVDWLIEYEHSSSREGAIELGQKFMDLKLFHHVCRSEPFRDGNFYYRFQQDEKNDELNMFCIWIPDGEIRDALTIGTDLRKRIEDIYVNYISLVGVDYEAIAGSQEWEEYVIASAELQAANLISLTNNQKKVFFINLYNMLTIHGIIKFGSPTTAFKRNWFFSNVSYNIGGSRYSLNDIEHGILRGNKTPPGGIFRLIQSNEIRAPTILSDTLDPRIHFALVCGAKGCPPVRIYSLDEIDDQLNLATDSYLEMEVKVKRTKIFLPKIMQWYKSDFGNNDHEILNFVCSHLPEDIKQQIIDIKDNIYEIHYNDYDWNINSHTS